MRSIKIGVTIWVFLKKSHAQFSQYQISTLFRLIDYMIYLYMEHSSLLDVNISISKKTSACLGQLYKLHRGAAPQKTWSLWSTPLGALTTSHFFLEQSAWSWTCLAKKRGAKLKNVERNSPKHEGWSWCKR